MLSLPYTGYAHAILCWCFVLAYSDSNRSHNRFLTSTPRMKAGIRLSQPGCFPVPDLHLVRSARRLAERRAKKKNKLASDPRTMSNARSRQLAYFKDNIQTQDDQVESSMTCLN